MRTSIFLFSFLGITSLLNAQNIEYLPLYTSATFNGITIDVSRPVGSTPGQAAVSGSGAATYSIPVALPPGTNGVMPSVSLEYHSQTGSGIAGMGWNLSGLSAITRVPQNVYFDGVIEPVQFDTGDRFAIDGKRLVLKNGGYGTTGSTYGTEVENFTTVTLKTTTSGSLNWLEVVTREGITMEYGNTEDSRFLNEAGNAVIFWMLNRVIHPDGNYVDYEYITSGRDESRISRILYTGNQIAGTAPYNEIQFDYKIRQEGNFSDIRTVHIGGSAVISRFLLDKITVKAEGSVVKTYQLGYGHNQTHSFLKSVQEIDGEGVAINPTIFKYGDPAELFTTINTSVPAGNNILSFSSDFNGDGLHDLVTASYVTSEGADYVSEFKVWKKLPAPSSEYGILLVQNLPATHTVYDWSKTRLQNGLLTSDFDGDGLGDVLTMKVAPSNPHPTGAVHELNLYRKTAGGPAPFQVLSLPLPESHRGIEGANQWIQVGDFNGDSRADYLLFLTGMATGARAFIGSSTSTGWNCSQLTAPDDLAIPLSEWRNADGAQTLDFDGDGSQELMLVKGSVCEIYRFSGNVVDRIYQNITWVEGSRLFPGDFNGDGITDFLRIDPATETMSVLTGTGSEFTEKPFTFHDPWPVGVEPEGTNNLAAGDFNGDGKTDIYHGWIRASTSVMPEGVYLHQFFGRDLYYSTGDGFSYQQVTFDVQTLGPYSANAPLSTPVTTFINDLPADLNGDGKCDLISSSGSTLRCELFNLDGRETLLQKVKTGMGHQSEWIYEKTTDGESFFNNNSYASTFPLTFLNPALTLAKKLIVSNGSAGNNTIEYGYYGAAFHRQGKGFLGFAKTEITDHAMNTHSVSENQFNTVFYTAVPTQTVQSLTSGNPIAQETMNTELVNSGPKRFWFKINALTHTDALAGVTTTTDLTYDAYANVTRQNTTIPGVITTVTETTYGAYSSVIPNKPTLINVTQTANGESPFESSTRLEYNAIGRLISKTDFNQLPKAVTTTYNYNNFGNQTSATVSAAGIAPRTTVATYDSIGRYPIQTTNELSQVGTATYDPKWGTPLTATGVDGLSTSYEYDSWGRLAKTTFPQGYHSNITYHWDVNGDQRFYQQTATAGKPTVRTWYDLLGREIRTETEEFDGQWSIQTQSYDARGNLHQSSDPHFSSENFNSTTRFYDDYNRLTHVTHPVLGMSAYSYSYSAGQLTVTINDPSGISSQTSDAAGRLLKATDDSGTISYAYYSHGGLKAVKSGTWGGPGPVLAGSTYDPYGRQTTLIEINAGTTEYEHDALGQLVWQKTANGDETTFDYNLLGQIVSRVGSEGTTSYVYGTGNSDGEISNRIKSISGFSGTSTSYTYNKLGQLIQLTEINDGNHMTSYTYNAFGDVSTATYPSGLSITYQYNNRGYLEEIKQGLSTGTVLYKTHATNSRGQVTAYKRANSTITSNVSYTHGFPVAYTTSGIQDFRLAWDYRKGNVSSREDARPAVNKTETFTYDNLQRLTGANVATGINITASYAPNGNLSSKSDAGSYTYHDIKIHAVTEVSNSVSTQQQEISYTSFMQPETVKENGYLLTYNYGADYNRVKTELKQGNNVINTRYYYAAGFERDISGGTERYIQYIGSPAGLIAIVESIAGNHIVHYTYTDHLGSILTVTSSSGVIEAEQSFDAWGRRRGVSSWAPLSPTAANSLPVWLYRGYTGHEHLDQYGLINMNGRMYDPVLGRMLSPDNYVPDPLFSQDYNRYTYARNNPLVYTDPDGEFWHIVIGAALGGGINLGVQAALGNVNNFGDGLRAFGKGALVGGMAAFGCSSCGIGTLLAGSALAVGNTYLPSYSVGLGNSGFSVTLGMSVGFGSTGLFAGANVGFNYSSEIFSAGVSYGIGYYLSDHITGNTGGGQSLGGGVILGGNDFRLGVFTNQFKGRGLDQRTGTFYLESNGWSAAYENDWMPLLPIGDGGDRFRTAGVRIAKGDFSIGLNLFTGDPGLKSTDRETTGKNVKSGFWGTYRENTERYRLGALYGAFKGYRTGWSSERIRNIFQNNFAHGRGYTHPLFEVLQIKGSPYVNYYHTGTRFTTWY